MKTPKCNKNHSGNKHLTKTVKGCYECDGCGQIFTAAQLKEMTK